MNKPRQDPDRQDPERLAALLDGRLDAAEREALLAELAASPDALDALGDVAAVLRDLEEAGHVPAGDLPAPGSTPPGAPQVVTQGVPEPPPDVSIASPERVTESPPGVVGAIRPGEPRYTRGRAPRWVALAAAVVVAAVGISLYTRASRAPFDRAGDAVALLAPGALPGDVHADPWAVMRGGQAPALGTRARAVRYGARAAELALAVRARQGDIFTIAQRTASTIADVPAGAPVVELYHQVASHAAAPPDSLAPLLAQAWDAAVALLGADDARLGAWLYAARVAAARQDAAFFRTWASRRTLAALAARGDVDPAVRQSAAALRGVADAARVPWTAVGGEIDGLLTLLASDSASL